ncbi:MAG: MipA/OmpV family protein [Candidatus Polarisedimenticolaceae bacterium]|nr:MipA/OmpV family protein [Candidatus Polarisedimenticolaceae bacterium]
MKFLQAAAILALSLTLLSANAGVFDPQNSDEQYWGLATGLRMATVPLEGDSDQTSFVMLNFFENSYVYLDGLDAGVKLRKIGPWEFNVVAKARFFDISERYQKNLAWDVVDFGAQLRYQSDVEGYAEAELFSDFGKRLYANLRTGFELQSGDLQWQPYLNLRVKSADFNSRYYGVGVEDLDAGTDVTLGLKLQYPLMQHVYLYGLASATLLDEAAKESSFVDETWQGELFAGIAYYSDKKKMPRSKLHNQRYMRLAHGWATPSNLHEMVIGKTEHDSNNNQLTSIFYGHPLILRANDSPVDLYLTSGFVWHQASSSQSVAQEYVLGLKVYYRFYWPIVWRVGAAEGLSYITKPTYIEQSELEEKNFEATNLMNYLGFSVDLNMGDLLGVRSAKNLWLGYAIHHRSGMFKTSSLFGRVKGGSNYETLYLQWDF